MENDGGPAFPFPATDYHQNCIGMSLRQYFAGEALVGLLAAEAHPRAGGFPLAGVDKRQAAAMMATNAFVLADAMLEASVAPPLAASKEAKE